MQEIFTKISCHENVRNVKPLYPKICDAAISRYFFMSQNFQYIYSIFHLVHLVPQA